MGGGGGEGVENLSLLSRYFLLDKEMVTFWSPETTSTLFIFTPCAVLCHGIGTVTVYTWMQSVFTSNSGKVLGPYGSLFPIVNPIFVSSSCFRYFSGDCL